MTTHKVATDALETLGTSNIPENSGRDAIHLAVEPVIAGMTLKAGDRIELIDGQAFYSAEQGIGIVDPFLDQQVTEGQRFWLVVLPRTITSLRHVWSHPMFPEEAANKYVADADDHYVLSNKEASEKWMTKWAKEHMSEDYYDDWNDVTDSKLSDERAYTNAIDAGRYNNVGPYEDARDHINQEWWDHWEVITGQRGKRDDYFSCSC